jgi:hypothetical protein
VNDLLAKVLLGEAGAICAMCCKEFGVPLQGTDNHGLCARHIKDYFKGMFPPERIEKLAAQATTPDMAQPRATAENVVPTRGCAECEQEHGILDRSDPHKSHGQCKRHFIQFARKYGESDAEIQELLAKMPENSWCPDLGAPPAR